MDDLYYTPKEVSKLLKVSKPTVYKWIEAGILQGVRIGGTVRIPRESVAAAIQRIWPDEGDKEAAAGDT